mmetsp:Transcript_8853/g.14733  ORF Transcript_8853/g.14733 Transcript_8853/m.14733 type:complete len:265 (+) Transcript_8853:859-1653(+)
MRDVRCSFKYKGNAIPLLLLFRICVFKLHRKRETGNAQCSWSDSSTVALVSDHWAPSNIIPSTSASGIAEAAPLLLPLSLPIINSRATSSRLHLFNCAVCCLVAVMKASGVNMPPTQKTHFIAFNPVVVAAVVPSEEGGGSSDWYLVVSHCARWTRSAIHSPRVRAAERATYCWRQCEGTTPRRRLTNRSRRKFVPLLSPLQYAIKPIKSLRTRLSTAQPFWTSRASHRSSGNESGLLSASGATVGKSSTVGRAANQGSINASA